jgi:DNA-binding MarR family transcriptional regulator
VTLVAESLASTPNRLGEGAGPLTVDEMRRADAALRLVLAARLNTSKQALMFVVDRLERDGYLVRVADPEDRRAKRIHLTQTGHQVARVSDAAMRRIERRWRVRAGDWARLRATLADLARPS